MCVPTADSGADVAVRFTVASRTKAFILMSVEVSRPDESSCPGQPKGLGRLGATGHHGDVRPA